MRILQIISFYDHYLRQIYRRVPDLSTRTYAEQLEYLLDDGFSSGHLLVRQLRELGVKAELLIPNALSLQAAWAQERGLSPATRTQPEEILKAQIGWFQPDVIYCQDPYVYGASLLTAACKRCPRILGWWARPHTDPPNLAGYDAVLTSDTACCERVLAWGARHAVHFAPGFPEWVADAVSGQSETEDLVFCGSIGANHRNRAATLISVARLMRSARPGVRLRYYTDWPVDLPCPPDIASLLSPPVWGMEMFKALRRARLVVNVHADISADLYANMRTFEALGTGTLLLTEDSPYLQAIFQPSKELEVYSGPGDLVGKALNLLDAPERRRMIAHAGQERCLREHGMRRRAQEFIEIATGVMAR